MSIRLEDLDPSVLAKAAGDWAEQSPVEPVPGYFMEDPEEWLAMHSRFCQRAAEGGVKVLFFGDSITQGWAAEGWHAWQERFAPLPAANFGIGGDRTQQLLWRIDHGTLNGIEPEVVVLLIGVNNLWTFSHSAADVAEGIKAVAASIHQKLPKTRILLLGVLPTGEEPDSPFRPLIQDINLIIAQLHDGDRVVFADMGSLFLLADGRISPEVMPDFLHLSPSAYAAWADALGPRIAEMLGREP